MTLLERARARKPITWLTVVGLVLLPVVLGGVLIAALNTPTDRLENMTAAIVNNDDPVTVDGQYTPLGRQLAAGLVEGVEDESNLTWVLSNDDDAAEGIDDGTYQAVVTIPENFSAAAMSSAQKLSGEDETPEQATIDVATSPDALILDQAIADQLASVATGTMGSTLTEATLSNLLVGFGTMGDQLGDAADGAGQLADGAGDAQDGADELGDGATQLADGIGQLGDGVSQLADGAGSASAGAQELAGGAGQLADGVPALTEGANGISTGAGALADGAGELTDGANGLSDGASSLSDGIDQLEAGVTGKNGLVSGSAQLADGLGQLQAGVDGDGTAANPGLVAGANALADGLADGVAQIRATDLVPDELDQAADGADAGAAGVSEGLQALVDECDNGTGGAYCAEIGGTLRELSAAAGQTSAAATGVNGGLEQLAATAPARIADQLQPSVDGAAGVAAGATQVSDGLAPLTDGASALASGAKELSDNLPALSDGATQVSDGATQLADGTTQLGDGATELAGGAGQLADGTTQLGDGANALSTGASSLADGVGQLATGAGQAAAGTPALEDGATQLADGTIQLGDGIGELGDGASELSDGLGAAVDELPSLSESESDDLAGVLADPVTSSSGTGMFGAAAIPLLSVAVLWFGSLATFVALRAVPKRALTSRRSSVLLTAGALLPAAIIGAVQGALVAVIVQIAANYDGGVFWGFAGTAVLAGVAFAAVNQALVAVFGGIGRWISGIVGALAVALGIISTIPAALLSVRPLLPTTPAFDGLLSVITETSGVGTAVVGLIVWAVLALIASTIAVVARRGVDAKALLRPRPAH